MIKELQKRIELFNKAKENIKSDLKKVVVDKSYPLNERWDLFIESNLGEHTNYYVEFEGFEGINSDRYYDDFYIEKYETVQVKYLLKRGIEKQILDSDYKINMFKEDVLTEFIKSFEYNW